MIKRLPFCLSLSLLLLLSLTAIAGGKKEKRDFYEIRIYHCKTNQQVSSSEQYLKLAYLPALHRYGINHVGVFKPIDNDTLTDKKIVVFIPLSSIEQFASLEEKLLKDEQLKLADTAYTNAPFDHPAYERLESVILKAFKDMPQFTIPTLTLPREDRIFELRSYEGSSERLYQKKVSMFNEGKEIGIFKRLNFNAVFYAEVLSGAHMPNLMYMTSFNNIKEHDEHWKSFGSDPEWKRISTMPEYLHTVSKSEHTLMHSTEYSDL